MISSVSLSQLRFGTAESIGERRSRQTELLCEFVGFDLTGSLVVTVFDSRPHGSILFRSQCGFGVFWGGVVGITNPDEVDTGSVVDFSFDGTAKVLVRSVVRGDNAPFVSVTDPGRFEDESVTKVVKSEMRDRGAGGSPRPVRVEDECITSMIENLGFPVSFAVAAG